MLPLVLLLVFAVVILSVLLAKASQRAIGGPLRLIPGPQINRWSRLPLKLQILSGQRLHYIHHLHAKYGPVVRISPTEVAISDLVATREIHRIGSGFFKSAWYAKFTDETESPGIFAIIDPKVHAVRRRLFSQAFAQKAIEDWDDLLQERISLAVTKIKTEATAGRADILKWWTFMATDIIAEMSFGESFKALEHGEKSTYSRDLETVMILSGLRTELQPLISMLYYIPLPAVQRWSGLQERLKSYGRAAITKSKALEKRGENRGTLFSKMILTEDAKDGLSLAEIEREASNLIVAGSDTTAVTLTYLVWAVLKHPAIKIRLQHEIDELPSRFSAKQAYGLPYLNCVIRETLRLYGAAPGSLPRAVPPDGRTLGGFYIPEGTEISTQAFTLHREPRIFSDPLEFIPERWLEPTQDMKDAFMPFGGGSRVCIGIHLAYLELSLASALFFKNCSSARIVATDKDMEIENHFLIAPKAHKCEIVM